MFVAEARAAALVDHPNVCTIVETGESEDGQLFIAMPLYEGETLQARLERERLAFGEALPIVFQIARGLDAVHHAGIVHRDVKPSNIFILASGGVKILDFGIAQFGGSPARDDREMLAGTVSYMSPEQASARRVDRRSDIWSLAIVVHEMLTGIRPFEGPNERAVRLAILEREPRLTTAFYADVPAGVDGVLLGALAKPPHTRPASMSHLARALSALVRPDARLSGRQAAFA